MIKRIFDIISSLIALIVLSPLLGGTAIIIKLDSPGPVFYRGIRVGKRGRLFSTFKFRTMVVDAEKKGGASTADDDPRITDVGKILRKYKLDEMPQLFDVLRGTMSIVGPRPEVKHYVDMFTEEEKVILTVRPGITDWATLWNPDEGVILAGSEDPEKTYMEEIRPEKIRLQLKYVKEQSLRNDMKIIFDTVKTVIMK
ncbi:MAG: sugar transferase [Candidatus Omnitrophica bacterium]|nr:sugar transferase [Candidatus Omnitrophota bacterium]